jgi:hypothetical protein
MGVGAAVAAGSAVAGIAGSVISSNAAGKAAKTQADAAGRAADMQAQQQAQVREDLGPYRDFGGNALGLLNGIFGSQTPTQTISTTTGGGGPVASGPRGQGDIPPGWSFQPGATMDNGGEGGGSYFQQPSIRDASGNTVFSAPSMDDLHQFVSNFGGGSGGTTTTTTTPGGYNGTGGNILTANGLSGLTFQPTQAQLEATPGYQFIRAQGLQSVQNSNAAKGLGLSGAALKGAGQYATGLASQTLGQQQGIFQSNLNNIMQPLEWAANLGQTAATRTGQNSLQATANQGNMITSGAAAQAAGQVGSANALAGGLNSAAGAGQNYLLYNNLLNGGPTAPQAPPWGATGSGSGWGNLGGSGLY